jgi:hypothetical protein
VGQRVNFLELPRLRSESLAAFGGRAVPFILGLHLLQHLHCELLWTCARGALCLLGPAGHFALRSTIHSLTSALPAQSIGFGVAAMPPRSHIPFRAVCLAARRPRTRATGSQHLSARRLSPRGSGRSHLRTKQQRVHTGQSPRGIAWRPGGAGSSRGCGRAHLGVD